MANELIKCVNCGALMGKGKKFCTECGKPLNAPAPQAMDTASPAQVKPAQPPVNDLTKCANCGALMGKGKKFCTECGARLANAPVKPQAAFCRKCGAALKPGVKFCTQCGAQRMDVSEM